MFFAPRPHQVGGQKSKPPEGSAFSKTFPEIYSLWGSTTCQYVKPLGGDENIPILPSPIRFEILHQNLMDKPLLF